MIASNNLSNKTPSRIYDELVKISSSYAVMYRISILPELNGCDFGYISPADAKSTIIVGNLLRCDVS